MTALSLFQLGGGVASNANCSITRWRVAQCSGRQLERDSSVSTVLSVWSQEIIRQMSEGGEQSENRRLFLFSLMVCMVMVMVAVGVCVVVTVRIGGSGGGGVVGVTFVMLPSVVSAAASHTSTCY